MKPGKCCECYVSFLKQVMVRNKHEGIKHEIRDYRKKRMRIISATVTFIIVFSLIATLSYCIVIYYYGNSKPTNETNGPSENKLPRAALIDALYSNYPNEEFTKSLNKTLQDSGFKVDIYQGAQVTVDFLKNLKSGYKLVILRMHSALSTNNELYFFTAEPYSVGKYTQEQYFQLVKEAYAREDSPPVFAVNWGFIKSCMTEKFNGTLVIAMGCEGACDPYAIKEILDQGATGYVSWTGPVSLFHSDKTTLFLVRTLYLEKLLIAEAVEKTNDQIGEDPDFYSILECYLS